jgi:hypothetical protein
MNPEVLLYWMTHTQEGSWETFRSAIKKLAVGDADPDVFARRLRIFLSDFGHADFFIDGTQRWRVQPPALAGIPHPGHSAVLTGGRTPKLLADLAEGAAAHGCRVLSDPGDDRPAIVRVEGDPRGLSAAAAVAGIPFVESFASVLCGSINPIARLVEAAAVEQGPGNWSVRSFDFDSHTWVDGLRGRSACEFRSRYGPGRYYLHTRRGRLLRLGKREAVYAAAMIRGIAVATYDAASAVLSVPASAPLPEVYARAACLCAGMPSVFQGGRFCYVGVPRNVAAVLLVAAGQPYPEPHAPGAPVRTIEPPYGQPV